MKHSVLFVDDEINILKSLQRALMDEDYECYFANSGQEALSVMESRDINVIITDMRMPIMNGLDLLKIVKSRYPDVIKGIFTGHAEISQIAATINQIDVFKFVLKPWDLEKDLKPAIDQSIEQYDLINNNKILTKKLEEKEKELIIKNEELSIKLKELEIKHFRLEKMSRFLENADSIILAIADAVEAKDKSTKGHINRVSYYVEKIGKKLCFSENEIGILNKGAILHDIGKIGIPDNILNKPGPLNDEEFEIMKQHTVIGSKIVNPLKSFNELQSIIRHHHEKLNGSGYPDGLANDEINIYTRIITVVDIYDALTMDRAYRSAMKQEEAMEILKIDANKGLLDNSIIEILEDILLSIKKA